MIQFFVKIMLPLVFLMASSQVSLGQAEADTLAPVTFIPPADQLHYMNDTTHWMVEIPLWIPGLRGALAYGDINIEIGGGGGGDENSGFLKGLFNSASKLDYFMVGRIQYRWNRLFLDSDIYGGKINNSVTFIYNDQILLETQIELIIGRASVGYTFIDHPFKNEKAGRIRSYGVAGLQVSDEELLLEVRLNGPVAGLSFHF